MKYLVVVEKGSASWGAHVPDLPGCVAAGDSREEVLAFIGEAIELHLEDMRSRGHKPPVSASEGVIVEVDAA